MIMLGILAYLLIGAFFAGIVFSLNNEPIEPIGAMLMSAFAPLTLLYVLAHLAILAGQKITSFFMK